MKLRIACYLLIGGLICVADNHHTAVYVASCNNRAVAQAYMSKAYMTWARYIDVAKLHGPWPNRRCGK